MALSLILTLVLVVLCAFFSMSEISMMAINRYRLMHRARNGDKSARRVLALIKRPDRLLGVILIGNTLVSNIAASLTTQMTMNTFANSSMAALLATTILTVAMLIIGEVMPKTWAALRPEQVAPPCSRILTPLLACCFPLVVMVNGISNYLLRLCGLRQLKNEEPAMSSEELRAIVSDAGRLMPARNHSMLLSIIDLDKSTVDDIMVPRHEIDGIDLDWDDVTLLAALRRTQHTRLPVYRGTINNVVGILHIRNVPEIINQPAQLSAAIVAAICAPYFIPESTPLHTQLLNFRQHGRRLGVVVDEYGEVTGLISLEDILEEIVGDFTAHVQPSQAGIFEEESGCYRIAGSTLLRDINRHLGWQLPLNGPRTLNGLLLEHLENLPQGPITMRIDNYQFEVSALQHNAVVSARCWKLDPADVRYQRSSHAHR
ncbi:MULTISPECIES: HlyC/CorC family transporter [unclassified Zymobacter]|uniref:HlyC/CorC family transporter n=1 Tax=unclassified Zymobacter TaxID=3048685 RepID=UPI0039C06D52